MQQRYERQYAQYNTLPTHLHESDEDVPPRRSLRRRNESVSSRNVRLGGGVIPTPKLRPRARSGSCSGCTKVDENAPGPSFSRPQITVTEIEDLKTSDHELEDDDAESLFSFNDDLCAPSKHPCDPIQRRHCTTLLERYRQTNYLTEPEEIGIVRDRDDEFQMLRHIILLLLLCSSMFVVSRILCKYCIIGTFIHIQLKHTKSKMCVNKCQMWIGNGSLYLDFNYGRCDRNLCGIRWECHIMYICWTVV